MGNIITLTELKDLLKITTSEYDSLLTDRINITEKIISDYTNNDFTTDICYQNGSIALVSDTLDTITDSESNFLLYGFKSGNIIKLFNTENNRDNQIRIATTITSNTMTLENNDDVFVGEIIGTNNILIKQVVYPISLQDTISKMIQYDINIKGYIKGESLGDYSVTYNTDSFSQNIIAGYPDSITNGLKQYRQIRFI